MSKTAHARLTERQFAILRWFALHYDHAAGWFTKGPDGKLREASGPPETWTHYVAWGSKMPLPEAQRLGLRTKVARLEMTAEDQEAVRNLFDMTAGLRPRLHTLSNEGVRLIADGPFCAYRSAVAHPYVFYPTARAPAPVPLEPVR